MKTLPKTTDARPGCLSRFVRRLSAWAWGWEIARSKDAEMMAKCHTDNCRSISQLANELGQARDAERLVRMQLAKARETLQRLSAPNIVHEPHREDGAEHAEKA